jgi:phosphotransferase system HPr (HPr) family protein
MKQLTLLITSEVGLHARPAALFVQQASQFSSEIQIRNLTTESEWVDGRSILSVLTLGVEKNHEIELKVSGDDEQQAIETLTSLVNSGFGES